MTQKELFKIEQNSYIYEHKFPQPQYLGSKYNFREWIYNNIPSKYKINKVFDAFAGSQSIAYYFKQHGFQVITNDFLNFNYHIGKALIENSTDILTENDVNMLFSHAHNKDDFHLIEELYTDLFFERQEAIIIDNFRANIDNLNNSYKQSLAISIMNRSLTRKVTMGHFAHTKALSYASNPERVKRNRSLIKPIKDIFLELVPEYNNAIFDNNHINKSMCMNVLDAVDVITDIDLIYLDPPYCDSHADYQSFYHLLETFTNYWKDKKFINSIKRYEPKLFSGFDKKSDFSNSLLKLFDKISNIPYWIMSYNDRSYPDVETLYNYLNNYKNVHIEKRQYLNNNGGKGSVKDSNELLLICTPK